MSVVVLGQNRFIDCDAIVGHKGRPLLRIRFDPFGVEFATPPATPSIQIRVDRDGDIQPQDPSVRVVRGPNFFSLFWKEQAIVVATLLDPGTAHVKLDLRPLGIKIYDDFQGLHIGTNTFAGNQIRNAATAIALGN